MIRESLKYLLRMVGIDPTYRILWFDYVKSKLYIVGFCGTGRDYYIVDNLTLREGEYIKGWLLRQKIENTRAKIEEMRWSSEKELEENLRSFNLLKFDEQFGQIIKWT